MTALERAIEVCGTTAELASRLGLKWPSVVGNWKLRDQVPAEYCLAIETATGGAVTRYDLRPDVFGPAPKQDAA